MATTFFSILNDYALWYIYVPFLIFYWFGWPRFIIRIMNKILLVKEPYRNIPIFLYFTLFFVANAIISFVQKNGCEKKVLEEVNKSQLSGIPIYSNNDYENNLRNLYRSERNSFIFFWFFIASIIYVKFSYDYQKIYELEEKRNSLKKTSLDFGSNQNPRVKKHN